MLSRHRVHEAGHALVAALVGFRVDYDNQLEVSGNLGHRGLSVDFDRKRPVEVAAVTAAGNAAETVAFGKAESLEDVIELDNLAATLVLDGLGPKEAIEIARKGCALAERRLRDNWERLTEIARALGAPSDRVSGLLRGLRGE